MSSCYSSAKKHSPTCMQKGLYKSGDKKGKLKPGYRYDGTKKANGCPKVVKAKKTKK